MKKIILILIVTFTLVGCKPKTPSITTSLSLSQDIINVYETHFDAGCYIVDGDNSVKMNVVENNIDNETIGNYFITYHKNYLDKDYVCKRLVKVVDDIPPTLTLNNGVDTIFVGDTHIDASITVTDNYDTLFTIITSSDVNSDLVGTYTITYRVTDSNNNTQTIIRYVNVIEK